MSVTTVANPVSSSVLQVLTDYDLHHSGHPESPKRPESPNPDTTASQPVENPENWDNDHRRVPAHRPVDQSRLGPERPGGTNPIEYAFIYVMLHGVGLIAHANTAWRATGGKINDRIFRYKIGGEW